MRKITLSRPVLVTGACALILFLNIWLLPRRYSPIVQVETMQARPMELVVRAFGIIDSKDSNTLRAQFDGPVQRKLFREGDKVKAGDLLAVLGRERIQLEYQNKVDALENAKADLAKARKEVRLQQTLYSKQAVAYSAVDDARRAVVKAEQALRGAQEGFRLARLQWDSAEVRSPMNGTVVKDWIGLEKTVSSGKELVTVADVSAYTARVTLDEIDAKRVGPGQTAEIITQGYSAGMIRAVVDQVGVAAESGGGLPQVPIVLKLLDVRTEELRPRMSAEASILTGKTAPVLSIPLRAVSNAKGDTRVWLIDALSRLRSHRVELGRSSSERVEVLKGLKAGQRIVTGDEPEYASGMRVRVAVAPAATTASKTNALIRQLPANQPITAPTKNRSSRNKKRS